MFNFYVKEISKLLEKSPKTYTKEDLIELSRHDVYVHAALQMHERGFLGWEQALIYCIMLLSKTCAESLERLAFMRGKQND